MAAKHSGISIARANIDTIQVVALLRIAIVAGAFLSIALGDVPGLSIRGKLMRAPDSRPALELKGGQMAYLDGDTATQGVLEDKRLAGADFEAVGHFDSPDRFRIDPIHTRAMFVYKNGKKLTITYWCDVCYIRTYTPGACWCCQKPTDLDLREPGEP